jgi:hypothetical protein
VQSDDRESSLSECGRYRLGRRRRRGQAGLESRDLLLRRRVAEKMPQHFDDRIEGRRVLEELSGAGLDPRMRSIRDLFVETLHQTRLADAGLANDQRDLPFTLERTSLCARRPLSGRKRFNVNRATRVGLALSADGWPPDGQDRS